MPDIALVPVSDDRDWPLPKRKQSYLTSQIEIGTVAVSAEAALRVRVDVWGALEQIAVDHRRRVAIELSPLAPEVWPVTNTHSA
jgi:hypothetical protein